MEQNYRGDFMKNCKHCGAQLADDDTYCYFCGNPLEENNESVENVELVDDDKLITVYESNAKIYKKDERGKDIIISNIDKILTK